MHVNLPKGLNILRKGVKVLEWNKNYYRYEYHYSHYISNFSNIFRLDEDNLKKYIKGYQLDVASTRGHILLKYKNINVAFGKSDGSHIKNYYPKGIRH